MKKKTYEFDVVTEYATIDEILARLREQIPNAVIELRSEPSPGGGWSWVFVTIDEKDANALKLWYFGSAEEAAMYDIADYEVTKPL
jgi:hypothetical protein